jgi:TetR/AcrR family transcriptional repressor of mexJK operon
LVAPLACRLKAGRSFPAAALASSGAALQTLRTSRPGRRAAANARRSSARLRRLDFISPPQLPATQKTIGCSELDLAGVMDAEMDRSAGPHNGRIWVKGEPGPNSCSSILDDARHRRILLRATESFLSKGYAGTSVEDIAIEASVSKPTIYRIFEDKMGLALAVLQDMSASLERDCRPILDMDGDSEDCLTTFSTKYIQWMQRSVGKAHHYEILRLMIELSSSNPDIAREWREAANRAVVIPLSEYLQRRVDAGDLDDSEDSFLLASQFMGSIFHTSQSIVAENEFNAGEIWIRRKVRLFLRGCLRRP